LLPYRYVISLYWAVTTMSTVGYGDVVAINQLEMFVSMLSMLIGASVFAYFMGAMSTLLTALNTVNARMAMKRCAVIVRAHCLLLRRLHSRRSTSTQPSAY
jgi:hypothetical protein